MLLRENINQVLENLKVSSRLFNKNSETKNAFLAVCLLIDPTCNLTEINESAPYGGLIGPGNSILHNYCKNSKLLRVHAIFHDAYGFMKSSYNIGPGYVYVLPNLPNHFLFGHLSGLLFWLIVKFQSSELFDQLPF